MLELVNSLRWQTECTTDRWLYYRYLFYRYDHCTVHIGQRQLLTWTAGGGIEGLVTERWSMKLEYLDMGTPSTSLLPGSNETANNNLIRVGVNYHFQCLALPPLRGLREGEVAAKRPEGS